MSARICLTASSGCNYPEGECLGACTDKNNTLPEPARLKVRAVLRIDELGEDLKNHVPIDIGDNSSAAQVVWKMDDDDGRSPQKEAVARRFVACWNACLDEDTAMLEAIVAEGTTIRQRHDEALRQKEDYQGELNDMERQRDYLLAVLKQTRAFVQAVAPDGGLLETIKKAIASVNSNAALITQDLPRHRTNDWHNGKSLRDDFAAEAMQGLLAGHFAHHGHESYWPPKEIADHAYEVADAMLKAREA